jgi:hypothetical protein
MSREMLEAHAYRRPLEALVARHAVAYRVHLTPVLVAKEAETLHLTREIAGLERDRLVDLEPALRRAREELDAVSQKVRRVQVARVREEEQERLAWKAAELERQVAALHASWSWRITAPLRKLFGLLGAGR